MCKKEKYASWGFQRWRSELNLLISRVWRVLWWEWKRKKQKSPCNQSPKINSLEFPWELAESLNPPWTYWIRFYIYKEAHVILRYFKVWFYIYKDARVILRYFKAWEAKALIPLTPQWFSCLACFLFSSVSPLGMQIP